MSQRQGTPLQAALQSPWGVADDIASAPNQVFITASGVAVVIASGVFHQNGLSQVVIGPVKEMSMNARAASAGLNGFIPIPPNTCLATPIANTEPTTAIQSGSPAGRLSARRSPVTTAERSPMVFSRFIASRHSASVTMQVETQVAIVQTAGIPKNQMPAAVVGRSAMITSSIIRDTLARPCACGDELSM